MTRIFLRIYDYLTHHRLLAVMLMVVVLLICVLLSLRLRYQENVAEFLPQDEENARYIDVYNQLGDQGEITILFRSGDSTGAEPTEEVMCAIDDFELNWAQSITIPFHGKMPEWANGQPPQLRCRMDDSDALDAIDFIRDHVAIFLTPDDYHRADSLLEIPGYIAECLGSVKQILSQPTGALVEEGVANDPLNLFSPTLQRLQGLAASDDYQLIDGYLFDPSESLGYAFMESPFVSSDTKNNAVMAHYLQQAIDSTMAHHPEVKVSAVGASLIAVTNATQIKRDSFVAIALALVLIAVILYFTIGRKRNLLWLGFSIGFGWLFALAMMALFRPDISIIVVGIGSVLLGIAVNYPLHFIDHVKDHTDKRGALRDMVEPLVIGNITTVSAFACLLFVKAKAMQDLGLFGALMLVGTILFVMIFLPLWVKSGTERKVFVSSQQSFFRLGIVQTILPSALGLTKTLRKFKVDGLKFRGKTKINQRFKIRLPFFLLIVALTVVFALLSRNTSFDSDLHNINYMTAQQAADLEQLEGSLESTDMIYLVAQGATLDEALEVSAAQMSNVKSQVSSITPLIPTPAQQQERLQLWDDFVARHISLGKDLKVEAGKCGFTPQAFDPFVDRLGADYSEVLLDEMTPILGLGSNYILDNDSVVSVVGFLHASSTETESVKQHLRDQSPEQSLIFSQSDVGNNLVSSLSEDFNYILYVCGFVVFFFLWLSFGNLELSLLAFLPLTVGWFWILGLMDIAAVKFNIVNIILATFIFGQGDDYTIFITEGLVQEYAYGKRQLQGFRRSVVLSAALMFVGMGTLIVARHPAMRSLAEVALIGMAVVVFMSCYLPPIIFRWITTKKGTQRLVPVTLKRLLYTFVSLLVFVLYAFVLVTPLTLLYKWIGPDSEKKRLRYHRIICWSNRQALRFLPGVKHRLINEVGETFDNPAVIVANHQSHLDLLCMLMLSPKMVIVTNDWVWRNPVYGIIIRYAEFYPASNGYDYNLERMRSLVSRGYSVMIFPEGTRSRDCSIGRFHKGAFQLAHDLDIDIMPIYLHGTGHVMPKDDILLRQGTITIEVGRRVRVADDLLEEAKQMRHHFEEHYAQLGASLQDENYFRPLMHYQYLYKGREVIRRKPGSEELLRALAHPDQQVLYAPDNFDDALLMQHIVARPKNLIVKFPHSDDKPSQLIIGGGLSGLLTGALLAYDGYPVRVLEKNVTIGGGLQCFVRNKDQFPTGMHVFGGFQEGGLLREICTHLGIIDQLKLLPTDSDCFDEVVLPDGEVFRLPQGLDRYESYLAERFPEEKEHVHEYLRTLLRLRDEEMGLLSHSGDFLLPYNQLIDRYFENPQLRQLQRYLVPLIGAEEDKTPAYIMAMVALSHIDGSHQFSGGSQHFANALAGVIKSYGGEVLSQEEVMEVVTRNKCIAEVITRKGNHYSADNYISSIHPKLLLEKMDKYIFSPAFSMRVTEAEQTKSAFMVFLACEEEMPYINHPIYLFSHGHHLVLLTPCKGQLVIFEQMPFSTVEQWADSTVGHRPKAYLEWKKRYADELICCLSSYNPEYSRYVRLVETSSPLTIRDYYGNPQGCLYGNLKDCNHMAYSQFAVRTKIPNLLMTGQNINLHGMVGVAITAQETIRVVHQLNKQNNTSLYETKIDLSQMEETSWSDNL